MLPFRRELTIYHHVIRLQTAAERHMMFLLELQRCVEKQSGEFLDHRRS